jgi:phage baseplate assembly protein W
MPLDTLTLSNSLLERSYLGKGLASPLSRDPATGGMKVNEGEDNIAACIVDILTTRVGERVGREDFGTELPPMLFESITGILDVLPVHAVSAITRQEPRVKKVAAKAERSGETGVILRVSYVVKATGQTKNLVVPYSTES